MRKHLGKVGRRWLLFLIVTTMLMACSYRITGQAIPYAWWNTQMIMPCMAWIEQQMPRNKELQSATALVVENEKLRTENMLLHSQLTQTTEMRNENERLRSLCGMLPRTSTVGMVEGRVVGRIMDNWQSLLWVDTDDAEGLTEGSLVICPQGVVGVVVKVEDSYCTVAAVMDSSCELSIKIENTDLYGYVLGEKPLFVQKQFQMEIPSISDEITVGQQVVTADLTGKIPADIPVGRVESVQNRADGLAQIITLTPIVTLEQVDVVYCITANEVV